MREEDDLREFESALRTLRPLTGGVSPVGAAFSAGRRAGRRSIRRWQGAAALALALGTAAHLPRSQRVPDGPTAQPLVRSSEPTAPAWSSQSLQALQHAVQQRGIDSLPPAPLSPARAVRADEIL